MLILFLHGWQSIPGGVKPTYLKDHGHEVINPALDDNDFDAALRTAQAEFDKHQPQVVIGSSRGGAVAMNINSGDAKLVLLCPGAEGLQPRIDWLAFQGKDTEDAFMDPPERFLANESLQPLDSQGKLAQSERALMA